MENGRTAWVVAVFTIAAVTISYSSSHQNAVSTDSPTLRRSMQSVPIAEKSIIAELPEWNSTADDKKKCSEDGDCVISCRLDFPKCCDQLCQCNTAWNKDYAMKLDAFAVSASCSGASCPMARCASPEFSYKPVCQDLQCVASRSANPHAVRRREEPMLELECNSEEHKCPDGRIVRRTNPQQGCKFEDCD